MKTRKFAKSARDKQSRNKQETKKKNVNSLCVGESARETNVFRPSNFRHGLEAILHISRMRELFKTFFTLDYMNWINLNQEHTSSIFIEGILAITLESKFKPDRKMYNSYMMESLELFTVSSNDKQIRMHGNLYSHTHSSRFSKIFHKKQEIISQANTIMKYIAIIIAHQKFINSSKINRNSNSRQTNQSLDIEIEIVKVRMRLDDDFSLVLDKCILKKNWWQCMDNEDRRIMEWIDEITGLEKGMVLYQRDLFAKFNVNKTITVSTLTRRDFNNKFIIISADYINKEPAEVNFEFTGIIKYLKKHGLEFAEFYSTVGTKPAFIFFHYDEPQNFQLITQHYNTPAYCSNMLDSLDNINNKSTLFFLLKKLYPDEYRDFIADSFLLSPSAKYTPGKIYIARPVIELDPRTGKPRKPAFSGHDIIYIVNPETLAAAKRLIGKYDKVLISNYIANPLLFQGRKFHLRVYLVITIINSVVKTHFFPDGYIWTAAKPFQLARFYDKGIHDTHYKSTADDYLFSSDFNTANMGRDITPEMKAKLLDDMQSVMDKVSKVAVYGETGVKLYNNHKNSFQIEGIDIMVDENMQPILIECNAKPGFSNRTEKGIELQKRFAAFLNKVVLEPVFGK